jgi:hypothetical protein
MKKTFALVIAIVVVAAFAASSFARTLEEEKMAVREYLTVLDKKIVKARSMGQKAKLATLKNEKTGTLQRWEKLKAQLEAAAPAPAPVVAPAPVAAPVVAAAPAAAPATEGMGLSLGVKAGLVAGLTGITGDLDYSIDSILPGTKIRLSGDYVSGTNPAAGSDTVKVVDLKIGAIYSINDLVSGLGMGGNWYVGGAFILPVKVNGARTGKWGAEAYVGSMYMIPDFGSVYGELGYEGLKYTDGQAALKGINLSVGYCYMF